MEPPEIWKINFGSGFLLIFYFRFLFFLLIHSAPLTTLGWDITVQWIFILTWSFCCREKAAHICHGSDPEALGWGYHKEVFQGEKLASKGCLLESRTGSNQLEEGNIKLKVGTKSCHRVMLSQSIELYGVLAKHNRHKEPGHSKRPNKTKPAEYLRKQLAKPSADRYVIRE